MYSSAPGAKYRFFQNVYVVLNAKKGHSLLEIKYDLRKGNLTQNNASKLIHAIMITQKPMGVSNSWASCTSRFY
ncbi:MAG: hypothetical protein ACTSVK_00675 [Promethearchaeota archaeon]